MMRFYPILLIYGMGMIVAASLNTAMVYFGHIDRSEVRWGLLLLLFLKGSLWFFVGMYFLWKHEDQDRRLREKG